MPGRGRSRSDRWCIPLDKDARKSYNITGEKSGARVGQIRRGLRFSPTFPCVIPV